MFCCDLMKSALSVMCNHRYVQLSFSWHSALKRILYVPWFPWKCFFFLFFQNYNLFLSNRLFTEFSLSRRTLFLWGTLTPNITRTVSVTLSCRTTEHLVQLLVALRSFRNDKIWHFELCWVFQAICRNCISPTP